MAPFLFSIEFETYIQAEKRYSEHTQVAYHNDLTQFFDYIGINQSDEFKEVSSKVIRGWMVYLSNSGYTNKSINRKLSTLRSYFRFLKKEGLVDKNPLTGLNGPKVEKRLPNFAKESELDREIINNTLGLRDSLLVKLLYQTGMRLNELIELTTQSIYDNTIKVKGKRNKERIIPISAELKNQILLYREECRKRAFRAIHLF